MSVALEKLSLLHNSLSSDICHHWFVLAQQVEEQGQNENKGGELA